MSYLERITIDPGTRSGKPCIRVTRIAVTDDTRVWSARPC